MNEHIRIRKADGIWTVRADGAVLGQTRNALELTEGSYPAVIYFPRADLAMAMLDPSPSTSTCPWKGAARYYSIVGQSRTIRDAAWSYEAPLPGAEAIAGHIAFYPDKVTVEQI